LHDDAQRDGPPLTRQKKVEVEEEEEEGEEEGVRYYGVRSYSRRLARN